MSAGRAQQAAATPGQEPGVAPSAHARQTLAYAVLGLQRSHGNAAVCRMLRERVLARDEADDTIDKIEGEKLPIESLLDRCIALGDELRDKMIVQAGAHAAWIHEERVLASLLAAKALRLKMKRADFVSTYRPLLARLEPEQRTAVLDRVGKEIVQDAKIKGENEVMVYKRSINDVGMAGAPGSSKKVNAIVYVITDEGVQYKTSDKRGPAARNNNPGNITVNDSHPEAWDPEIGAYPGRNTDGRFAIFPTLEAGKRGVVAWAKRAARKNPSQTLIGYFEGYAPPTEPGNDPDTYADTVARHVNAATNEQFGRSSSLGKMLSLGKAAEDAFIDGHIEAEGFDTTNIECVPRDSPKLPEAVREFAMGFDTATAGTREIAKIVAASAAAEARP